MTRRFLWRLYSDFLMPSRLRLYEKLLEEAGDRGYELHSVASFWEVIKEGGPHTHARYLILRHDVDTDVRTARAMFAIEQKRGARASYYFRLSTLDVPFMKSIHQAGSEASYHYEEIAAFGKRRGCSGREEAGLTMPGGVDELLLQKGLPLLMMIG